MTIEERRGKLLARRESLIQRKNKIIQDLASVNKQLKELEETTFKSELHELKLSYSEALAVLKAQQSTDKEKEGETHGPIF